MRCRRARKTTSVPEFEGGGLAAIGRHLPVSQPHPARYAAGHLYRPDTADSHAAHGWAELWVDDYGWIGFDAFEGQCPTESYVRVAIGLDHRGAAPVSGARVGGGDEALIVDVHVGPEPAPQD